MSNDRYPDDDHRRREYDHWVFDKRIPLALVFAMSIQLGGFIWAGAMLYSNVEQNTKAIQSLQTASLRHEDVHQKIDDAIVEMGKIAIHMQYLQQDTSEIKKFLRDEVEWLPNPKKGK